MTLRIAKAEAQWQRPPTHAWPRRRRWRPNCRALEWPHPLNPTEVDPALLNERTLNQRRTIAEPGEVRTHVIPQPSTGSPPPEAVPMTTPQTSPQSTPAPATP